jgi:methionine synthase I (cobalamin-dependent)
MGTALYGRGVFLNKCFDELNLTQPELVRSVHEEYLQAGAEIIETNTFGANSFRLHRFGLQDQTRAINQAGARLAREAVAQLADKQAGSAFVAGSVSTSNPWERPRWKRRAPPLRNRSKASSPVVLE